MERFCEKKRNALGRWYDRHPGRLLPSRALLGIVCCLLLNSLVYWGTQQINSHRVLLDVTSPLDHLIPFDSRWVYIYLGAFPFWAAGYVLMARQDRWRSLLTGALGAKLVCGVLFLLIPSTNVRPEVTGSGLSDTLLRLVYALDPPLDLFPSIHCLESWFCVLGVWGRKEIPRWYRLFSGVFALLIVCSTLATRQHVLADVLAGVLLAQGFFALSLRLGWGNRLDRGLRRADRLLFGG